MNLRHIQLILKREYLHRVKNPGFIIGTILGVISIVALTFLPSIISMFEGQSTLKVAVVDPNGLIYRYLTQPSATPTPAPAPTTSPSQARQSISAGIRFSKADTNNESILSQKVKQGEIDAYVVVNGDRASNTTFTYHAKDRPSLTTSAQLVALLGAAASQARLAESGISAEQAQALFAQSDIKIEPIVDGTIKDEEVYTQSVALAYVLLLLLYATMVMYGVQVAMGVVEEKSSRVMEILITAVRPIELMIGKVLGVGLVGLTQYGLWVGFGFVSIFVGSLLKPSGTSSGTGGGIDIATLPVGTLVSFLVLFVLGYLLYASIYAALGSLVNRSEDANSITTPVSIVMVGTYLLSIVALGTPDADFVRWLSFVPFLTPMLMFIRIALSNPAWWEIALSVLLLLASSLFFAWLAAKIYRVGVLLYGKRPSFREIGRLLRAT